MRKIIILFAFCVIIPAIGYTQYYLDYGLKLGMANYVGDIGGLQGTARPWLLDMKLKETRWNPGAYVRYKIRDPFSLEADFDYLRIEGADSLSTNPARRARNLNFRNDILDLSFKGVYTFYENPDLGNTYRYQNSFSAYAFLGISIFYTNPYGYGDPVAANGQPLAGPDSYHGLGWYSLRPLKTEGVSYSSIQPGIPVGAGFNFTLSKTYRIGFEISWTETFTDYLDDVSNTYPTAAQQASMSPQALYFSNRTSTALAESEGIDPNNYGPGEKRGDPKNHDSFITADVTLGYVIRGRSNFYRSHYGGLFSKGKYRIRRRRAKF
jgi:hypothetical protein